MSGRNNKEVLEWAMKTRRPKSRKHENSEETSKGESIIQKIFFFFY